MKNGNRGNQRLLFSLADPLTARFGAAFFTALPTHPGVYFFTGESERLLYIGQSANLRARIGSYRHVAMGRHPRRSLRLVAGIRRIEWELCETPLHAIERERELLLERRPPFNRAGVWIGPPWWLEGETSPGRLRLHLARKPEGVGPLPSSFRYLLGPAVRGVIRALTPELPLHAYPHGLTRATVPTSISFPTPSPAQAWELISRFSLGDGAPLFDLLDALPADSSETFAEFWKEEMERLGSYVPKFAPFSPVGGGEAKTIFATASLF